MRSATSPIPAAAEVTMQFRPLADGFAAEILGLDPALPPDAATAAALRQAAAEHGVLVLRDHPLTPAQHIAFSAALGPLEIHIKRDFLLPGHPEILVLSNIVEDGKPVGITNFAEDWHTDGSHQAQPPLGAVLHALETPPIGADTEFAGMQAAYAALDPATQARILPLRAIHSYHLLQSRLFPDRALSEEVRRATPDCAHPVVLRHPVTGRPGLFLGTQIIAGVEGMPEPEGTELMAALLAHATEPRFVYRHVWRPGDTLMWDNRCVMHRVLPFDQQRLRRRMHRTTLANPLANPGAHAA
jgi:taurine dioxygenase